MFRAPYDWFDLDTWKSCNPSIAVCRATWLHAFIVVKKPSPIPIKHQVFLVSTLNKNKMFINDLLTIA